MGASRAPYVRGLPVGCPWFARGVSDGHPLGVRGLPVGCRWVIHGSPMEWSVGRPWIVGGVARGVYVGHPWVAHGVLHGFPTVCR